MKASLDQRIDYQVKCDRSIQIWRNWAGGWSEDDDDDDKDGGGEVHLKKAQKDAAEPFPRYRAESKKPNLLLKAEIVLLTEHLQRNPTYEKGKGRPLPAQGTPLANLTTINLSRKKVRKL